VRQSRPPQDARGEQLVVREHDTIGAVEHADPRLREPLERPEAVLEPVERRANVESGERDVTAAERQQCLARGQQLARDAVPTARCERKIGGARAVGDDGETHPRSTLSRMHERWAEIR
jgi:hypothetical protein